MSIKIVEVTSKLQLDEYIRLPEQLNRENNIYISSAIEDELNFHDPEKNILLSMCDTIKYLAFDGTECVGRVMGIIHKPWIELHNIKFARFFQLDYIDSMEVCDTLLNAVGSWATKFDINTLIGPLGFHDLHPQGCLIEGITKFPVLNAPAEFSTVPLYIHKPQVDILYDLFSYLIPVPESDPSFLSRIRNRSIERGTFKVIDIANKDELDPWIEEMSQLLEQNDYNKYGYSHMTAKYFTQHFLESYPILTFEFCKIALDSNSKLVAFVLAHPNISESILKFKESIGIWRKYKLRSALDEAERLDLFSMTVDKRVRGQGIDVLLILKLIEECRKAGIKYVDSNVIHEANRLARLECIKLQGEHYKMYRVFKKTIN